MRVQSDNKIHRLQEVAGEEIKKRACLEVCEQDIDSFEKSSKLSSEYSYLSGDGRFEKDARIEIVVSENHSEIWWDDLRDLANSLPATRVCCTEKPVKLDDATKETLRLIAKSAPHLRISI